MWHRIPPACGGGESVLDMLYWHYMEHNHCDSQKIRKQFDTLRKLVNFPSKEYDQVFYVVSDLCLEYGRQAFGDGIKLGVALFQELSGRGKE